jgi:hypothetical protein
MGGFEAYFSAVPKQLKQRSRSPLLCSGSLQKHLVITTLTIKQSNPISISSRRGRAVPKQIIRNQVPAQMKQHSLGSVRSGSPKSRTTKSHQYYRLHGLKRKQIEEIRTHQHQPFHRPPWPAGACSRAAKCDVCCIVLCGLALLLLKDEARIAPFLITVLYLYYRMLNAARSSDPFFPLFYFSFSFLKEKRRKAACGQHRHWMLETRVVFSVGPADPAPGELFVQLLEFNRLFQSDASRPSDPIVCFILYRKKSKAINYPIC